MTSTTLLDVSLTSTRFVHPSFNNPSPPLYTAEALAFDGVICRTTQSDRKIGHFIGCSTCKYERFCDTSQSSCNQKPGKARRSLMDDNKGIYLYLTALITTEVRDRNRGVYVGC